MTGSSGGSLKFHMDKLGAFHLVENHGGEYQITIKGLGLLYIIDMLKGKVEKRLEMELEQYDIDNIFSF